MPDPVEREREREREGGREGEREGGREGGRERGGWEIIRTSLSKPHLVTTRFADHISYDRHIPHEHYCACVSI